MSPEAQRVAIAEARLWENCRTGETCGHPFGHPPGWAKKQKETGYPQFGKELPDYPNDLNAMHEAEKTLTPSLWAKYLARLASVKGWDRDITLYSHRGGFSTEFVVFFGGMVTATSAQRAEAFLLTIGHLNS